MRKLLMLFLLGVLAILLTGCGGAPLVVSPQMLDGAGVDLDSGVATIADASVLKELAVHKTLQNRDTQIAKAAKNAGFKSNWQQCNRTVFYPGMEKPLEITEPCLAVSFTPMPEFKQPLPTGPSIHPGYRMVENIVHDVANTTLIGYGIKAAGEVLQKGLDVAGSDYSDSTFNQSFNDGNSANTGPVELPVPEDTTGE